MSPQGKARPSTPLAAFSHSSSAGSRQGSLVRSANHCAYATALYQSIMKTALYRIGNKPHRLDGRQHVCTKEYSTDGLKLPGMYGYKWPTLAEAYRHYTGDEIEGAHDALVDTEACLKVFQGLVQEGVVELVGR